MALTIDRTNRGLFCPYIFCLVMPTNRLFDDARILNGISARGTFRESSAEISFVLVFRSCTLLSIFRKSPQRCFCYFAADISPLSELSHTRDSFDKQAHKLCKRSTNTGESFGDAPTRDNNEFWPLKKREPRSV